MDFHPSAETLLLVGWMDGVLDIWDIRIKKKLRTEAFVIWDTLHEVEDSSFRITKVKWSDDGCWIGVATSNRIVHLYEFGEAGKLTRSREIVAHMGFVNDLAFCHPDEKLAIVTCGDDLLVTVWRLDGTQLNSFAGCTSPAICVCPHTLQNIELVLVSCNQGETMDLRYDKLEYEVTDAFAIPKSVKVCVTFQYSADDNRLFSSGSNDVGGHFIYEWDQDKRTIKEEYSGLVQKSSQIGVVHIDTTQSQFLAVGEDRQIKFLHMNTKEVSAKTNADGGLSENPRLRFNKEENLLAVSSKKGFKILANIKGLTSLKGVDHVKCQVVTLPKSADPASKVARLLYTKSGDGLLVLGSDGIQRLWKWGHSKQNPTPKATASVIPRLWQPSSGLLMINDISDVNLEEAIPWIVLSKDDSCVLSAAGGNATLFNMMTFEVLTRFKPLPPASASTVIAFHPIKKNIIAFGMENSIILIYDVFLNKVVKELIYHAKRITGLVFSENLNILVSSGADVMLCTWCMHNWDPRVTVPLEYLPKTDSEDESDDTLEVLVPQGDTHVQLHSDHIQLLVCHASMLALYDAQELQCSKQWEPQGELSAPISFGAYSSDCSIVYAAFHDGNVGVFDSETLTLRCHISPSAYLGSQVPPIAYPLVLATHPNKPNQLAVGFTDGSVHVIEPSDGKWGKGDGTPSVAIAGGILTAPAPDVAAPAAPVVAVEYRPLSDFFFFGNQQKQKKR